MGSDNVEPTPYTGKFRLFGRSEWETPPGMRWLIDGIIPLHASVLLFGQPKIGKKSFTSVSMGCAAAAGKPWCGHTTRKSKVLFIVPEGYYGIRRRIKAWENMHGSVGDNLRLLPVAINFFNREEVSQALRELKAQGFVPDFIIIDTLARSMSGGKENDTGDMSTVMELLEAFRRDLNDATILLIHHTTKDGLSYRGSSVLHAAIDGMIEAKSESLQITLTCAGFKDAPEFETFKVRCETIPVICEDGAEDVLAVKDRVGLVDILNQPFTELEGHARILVKTLANLAPAEGAKSKELEKMSKLTPSTYNRARKLATEDLKWLVGGKKEEYKLNPDGSWKAAFGFNPPPPSFHSLPSIHSPLKGGEVNGSNDRGLSFIPNHFHGSDESHTAPGSPDQGAEALAEAAELLKKGKT